MKIKSGKGKKPWCAEQFYTMESDFLPIRLNEGLEFVIFGFISPLNTIKLFSRC